MTYTLVYCADLRWYWKVSFLKPTKKLSNKKPSAPHYQATQKAFVNLEYPSIRTTFSRREIIQSDPVKDKGGHNLFGIKGGFKFLSKCPKLKKELIFQYCIPKISKQPFDVRKGASISFHLKQISFGFSSIPHLDSHSPPTITISIFFSLVWFFVSVRLVEGLDRALEYWSRAWSICI